MQATGRAPWCAVPLPPLQERPPGLRSRAPASFSALRAQLAEHRSAVVVWPAALSTVATRWCWWEWRSWPQLHRLHALDSPPRQPEKGTRYLLVLTSPCTILLERILNLLLELQAHCPA